MNKAENDLQKLTEVVATKSALEALKIFREEERRKRKSKHLQNVGELLENYLYLVEHVEKTTDETDIMGSKVRTAIVVTKIETAMKTLRETMEKRGEYEKYQAFKMLYMDPVKKGIKFVKRIEMTAKDMHCNQVTIRRWDIQMQEELSKYIFGIDALKLNA